MYAALSLAALLASQSPGASGDDAPAPRELTAPGVALPTTPEPRPDARAGPQGVRLLQLDLRVASGGEWDTNARRAVTQPPGEPLPNASRPGEVVADGLIRLLVDGSGRLHLAQGHELTLAYTLGAKRFFAEGDEDLLTHDLSLTSRHGLFEWLSLSPFGVLRSSRIRNGSRDYDLFVGGGTLSFHPHRQLDIDASAAFTHFAFDPEPRFDYDGPRVGLALTFHATQRLALNVRADHLWRGYRGNGLVIGTSLFPDVPPVPTFCDSPEFELRDRSLVCTPRVREDDELQLAAGASYRGSVVLGGQYLFRRQRSTSDLENIDRHRLSVFATVGLPLELTGSLLGTLQWNQGVSVTDTKFLAEDDENQNGVQVQLRRRLGERVAIELRYALFANQFSTAEVGFLRQTIYLGLGFRTGLLGGGGSSP